jgi:hypothetical protein
VFIERRLPQYCWIRTVSDSFRVYMIIIKDPIVIMKCRMTSRTLFLYFNLCLSEKVDSIPCSLTSAFFLTRYILQIIPLKHASDDVCNYAHPRSWRQLVLPISVRMSVRPSHIWFPRNNWCSSLANHLKCINQVSNHNRNVKFDFGVYCFIRFGDMPLIFQVE